MGVSVRVGLKAAVVVVGIYTKGDGDGNGMDRNGLGHYGHWMS